MNNHRKASILAAVLLLVFSSATAAADSHWYLGGSIGAAWASGLNDLAIQTGTICAIFICAPVAREAEYSLDDSGTDPMYGLGMVISGEGWGLRFEWERFTGMGHGFGSESDMDLVTMGLEYRCCSEN